MADKDKSKDYILDNDEECLRLERQAELYGFEDDLKHLSLAPTDQVLDVGCGSGAITRKIACAVHDGKAVGADMISKYIDFARHKASVENINNIQFEVGDALELPFEDDSFDVVWSKHLLQFVRERNLALSEFKRVLRPGGRIVCCNYDGMGSFHDPTDVELQQAVDLWWEMANKELGIDNYLGRKLPIMYLKAGFDDVQVDITPDHVLGGFGGDPERRWNWEVQFQSVFEFSVKVYGSRERAKLYTERLIELFNRPDVYTYCALFYVEGRKP
jgi:ubiquinone/menaquinone biosynthesis C-methylase UbiE